MKSPKQTATRKLDKIFSRYIRLRDTPNGWGVCCSCGKRITYEQMDAGHFINRRHSATRWREDNVHGQCRACNRFDEGNAAGYTLFMIDKYGKSHVEYLLGLKNEPAGFTLPDIELMIKEYKEKLT